MNDIDEELSLEFYHYFCNIIGSEDVVKTRRNIFTIMDFVVNTNNYNTIISSGSKAEGIDLKSSDYDQMKVLDLFRVYESMNGRINSRIGMPLLMDTYDTKPGFTKLKLYDKNHRNLSVLPSKWFDNLGQETYV